MNLIWLQLEAVGPLLTSRYLAAKKTIRYSARNFIEFEDVICAGATTVIATLGMLSGILPAKLTNLHFSKKTGEKFYLRNKEPLLPDVLENEDYNVIGFFHTCNAPEHVPFFHDKHAGITEEIRKSSETTSYTRWAKGSLPKRFKNIKPTLKKDKNAIFAHLLWPEELDSILKIIDSYEEKGINQSNTILIITGDHGHPPTKDWNNLVFGKKELFNYVWQRIGRKEFLIKCNENMAPLPHDLHLNESNIRVSTFISHPLLSSSSKVSTTVSALDLAPSALSLLKLSPSNLLPSATGISLFDHNCNACTPCNKRIIRVDNRYISQARNRIICLVNQEFRYIYRHNSDWKSHPFYKYKLEEDKCQEELYRREDILETHNLVNYDRHQNDLKVFRQYLSKSESSIHSCLQLSHDEIPGLQEKCLNLLKSSKSFREAHKIALYGAGDHTKKLLKQKMINEKQITIIFDDNPSRAKCFQSIPLDKPSNFHKYMFDLLLISSDSMEEKLLENAKHIFPSSTRIISLYKTYRKKAVKPIFPKYLKEEPIDIDIVDNNYHIPINYPALLINWDKNINTSMLINNYPLLYILDLSSEEEVVLKSSSSNLKPTLISFKKSEILSPLNYIAHINYVYNHPSLSRIILNHPLSLLTLANWITSLVNDQQLISNQYIIKTHIITPNNVTEWHNFCDSNHLKVVTSLWTKSYIAQLVKL